METDPTTKLVTGVGELLLVIGAPLALIVSVILLRAYRRAVLLRMRSTSTTPQPPPSEVSSSRTPHALEALRDQVRRGPRRSVLCQLAAGLAYAISAASTRALFTQEARNWQSLSLFVVLFLWPVIIAIALVAGHRLRDAALSCLAYAVLALLIGALTKRSAMEMLIAWFGLNSVPTILVCLFLIRRVRAVGPMVLALVIALLFGVNMAFFMLDGHVRIPSIIGDALGMNAATIVLTVAALGMIIMLPVGAAALSGLGRLYRAHAISDQSLLVDAVWLLFIVDAALQSAFDNLWAMPVMFAAFAIYLAASRFALKIAFRSHPPARLLFLRVFALGPASERVFRNWSRAWRYAGSIRMIAGPDLASSTVEPHEFLEFISGRLDRHFDLDPASSVEDQSADFDGRFRIYESFCRDDRWKNTFLFYAAQCDAALIDLRAFTAKNAGAAFELEQLMDRFSPERIVILGDARTELSAIHAIAAAKGRASPAVLASTDRDEVLDALCRACAT